jgi:predicted RNA binding protein YcfA (HicA-like mRNA interferase family)
MSNGRELVKECQKHGGVVKPGKGDHMKAYGPNGGIVVIPNREIGKGLFCKIKKQLILIGLAAFLLACAAGSYFAQVAAAR